MNVSEVQAVVKGFFTSAWKDAKLVPHTAMSAFLLWVTMWTLGLGFYFLMWPQIANAVDLAQKTAPQMAAMSEEMRGLKASLAVERWERQLKSKSDEIFDLELEIETLRSRSQAVSVLMLQRLNTLKEEKVALEKKIDNFTQQNAALLDPTL